MSVRIRLKKMGRLHRPFFRVNACDIRAPRDGKVLECLGTYDPLEKDESKRVTIKRDRAVWWIDQGAQPTETVWSLLKKIGIHPRAKGQQKRKTSSEVSAEVQD